MDNILILSIFNNKDDSNAAIDDLKKNGVDSKKISVLVKEDSVPKAVKDSIASSATTGGIIGGIAGILVGTGAIVVPAIGAILIGGPLATAFGVTGAAITGGVAGALGGGIVGALVGLGLSKEEAKAYEDSLKKGDVLIGISTTEETEPSIKRTLSAHKADDVKVVRIGEQPV